MSLSHAQLSIASLEPAAVADLPAEAVIDEAIKHGAVFTKRWVVDLILDLAGYNEQLDLAETIAIEPSCGEGAFLVPMVERLSASCRLHGRNIADAFGAIRAFDLQPASVECSRSRIITALLRLGLDERSAGGLVAHWIHRADFLLQEHVRERADFVLGNPPYIRLEDIPASRSKVYRWMCPTMIGRSDVFVGFFEAGLKALRPGGTLGYICADRWMRNQYGRRLRELIAEKYSLEATIEMHAVDAFNEEVSAYPSITIIKRKSQRKILVAETQPSFNGKAARQLAKWATSINKETISKPEFNAALVSRWFKGGESWPTGSPRRLALLSELENRLPLLESPLTGTRVGIGVATGADRIFITANADAVEKDRLLPLAMARDTIPGHLAWSGHFLINPWDGDSGRLVELKRLPRLRSYFESHREALAKRHVGQRQPRQWFRTIDRVDHSLIGRPKLLFPDMKMTIHPVLENGAVYPHHNLYYVISKLWDLEVLGGLLLSRVAQFFVESYAVRMRGRTLRFQAQYLRRIRVPRIDSIDESLARDLMQAFRKRDVDLATQAALRAYGIERLPQ